MIVDRSVLRLLAGLGYTMQANRKTREGSDHPDRDAQFEYINDTVSAALADPDGFALSLPRPAVIDEVQRAPDLMLAIKQILDQDQSPGQFLLVGSADLVTARVVADALPGRVEYVNLWSLSQAEVSGKLASVIEALLPGAPPQVTDAPKGRAASAAVLSSSASSRPSAEARCRPQGSRRPDGAVLLRSEDGARANLG